MEQVYSEFSHRKNNMFYFHGIAMVSELDDKKCGPNQNILKIWRAGVLH
jgi:hypothetical protein